MKAKVYLKKIRKMDAMINADIEELAQLEALATKTGAVMGGERVQTSGSQQKMADCVVKIVEMKDKINTEIDSYINYKAEARRMLCECSADCIMLLQKRYFGVCDDEKKKTVYKTWEEIAADMNFTYKWVSGGLHQRALSQFQKAMDERIKDDEAADVK